MGDEKKVNFLYLLLTTTFDKSMHFFAELHHCFFVLQGNEAEHINLKVLGQDNAVVQFKIKRHTPLRKLMTAYCERAVSSPILLSPHVHALHSVLRVSFFRFNFVQFAINY